MTLSPGLASTKAILYYNVTMVTERAERGSTERVTKKAEERREVVRSVRVTKAMDAAMDEFAEVNWPEVARRAWADRIVRERKAGKR